jgi:hypothetical protein
VLRPREPLSLEGSGAAQIWPPVGESPSIHERKTSRLATSARQNGVHIDDRDANESSRVTFRRPVASTHATKVKSAPPPNSMIAPRGISFWVNHPTARSDVGLSSTRIASQRSAMAKQNTLITVLRTFRLGSVNGSTENIRNHRIAGADRIAPAMSSRAVRWPRSTTTAPVGLSLTPLLCHSAVPTLFLNVRHVLGQEPNHEWRNASDWRALLRCAF